MIQKDAELVDDWPEKDCGLLRLGNGVWHFYDLFSPDIPTTSDSDCSDDSDD